MVSCVVRMGCCMKYASCREITVCNQRRARGLLLLFITVSVEQAGSHTQFCSKDHCTHVATGTKILGGDARKPGGLPHHMVQKMGWGWEGSRREEGSDLCSESQSQLLRRPVAQQLLSVDEVLVANLHRAPWPTRYWCKQAQDHWMKCGRSQQAR